MANFLEEKYDIRMPSNEPSVISKNGGTSQIVMMDNLTSDMISMKSFDSCSTKKDFKIADSKTSK